MVTDREGVDKIRNFNAVQFCIRYYGCRKTHKMKELAITKLYDLHKTKINCRVVVFDCILLYVL